MTSSTTSLRASTLSLQNRSTLPPALQPGIGRRTHMLPAIPFDHQHPLTADEIDDVRPENLLPTKLQPEQSMPAQALP